MSQTKLQLYNGALRLLEERKLSSLSENREPRRVLDDIWDEGAIDACLEVGLWNFAMRTVKAEYSPSVEPSFGFRYAFDKPTDWIRTAAVCYDENFSTPCLQYRDEAGYWFAPVDTLYIQYVSNDNQYGADLSLWPSTFAKFVQSYLALEACGRITGSKASRDDVESEMKKRKLEAMNKDAMNEPSKFPATGSWVRSRGTSGSSDRGPRGRLIG